ncbi:unnamed protein product [Effrenium voratum]|nr:unnamed protein product [Effrenium voratum]
MIARTLVYLVLRRVSFPMGAYGAKTLKYTTLYGTLPGMASLQRPLNFATLKQTLARRGELRDQWNSWKSGVAWSLQEITAGSCEEEHRQQRTTAGCCLANPLHGHAHNCANTFCGRNC